MAYTEADLLDNPVAGHPTLILRSPDFHSITEAVAEVVERPTPTGWWLFFLPSLGLLSLLGIAVSWTRLFPSLAHLGRLEDLRPEPVRVG